MPKRIIVVDDDKEIREIVTFVLNRNGFEVIAVSNGQELQQLLSGDTSDLIILDVTMLGQDGYQICLAQSSCNAAGTHRDDDSPCRTYL